MARKGGLGKGLDALIPGGFSSQDGEGSLFIAVDKVLANPRQPRDNFDEEGLQELANSIREHGILQPLIVTHETDSELYMLVAGERRLRAAQLAGLEAVPVVVREVTEQERLELALIENLQRSDLSPLETARAYRQLHEDFKLSHEEIADQVGKSRVAVTNTLRLLNLSEPVQKALVEGKISEGHARALLALDNPKGQAAALEHIIKRELNVRQTEEYVRTLTGEKPVKKLKIPAPPEVLAIEERLRSHFGTRVKLNHGKKGGSLVIYYYSDEELDGLISSILKE